MAMAISASAKQIGSEKAHEHDPVDAVQEPAPESEAKQAANRKAGAAAAERVAQESETAAKVDPVAQVTAQLAAGHAKAALAAILAAPNPGQVVDKIGAAGRARLAAGLDFRALDGHERSGLKGVFDHTPDGEVTTLANLLGARFHFTYVGKDASNGVQWEASGLRRAWVVLEALPPSHVEGNNKLLAILRYKVAAGGQAEGYYDEVTRGGSAAFGYDPKTIDDPDKSFSERKDPLYGVNAFNETVRHEIGHAVDARLGASNNYCIGNPAGGDWQDHGAPSEALVHAMVQASGGAIARLKDATQQTAIVRALAQVMRRRSFDTVDAALGRLPFWSNLDSTTQQALLADPVVEGLQSNNAGQQPWMTSKGGVALGGRVYQESYEQSWTSYDTGTRSRKVSLYQFRAPGEWFAEAYAAYYEPPAAGQTKGYKLAAVDATTKAWFDTNVDTAAAKETDDKSKGKPGAASGGASGAHDNASGMHANVDAVGAA